jgi:CRISPR-associated negative auto-regulator DevR/Csa2
MQESTQLSIYEMSVNVLVAWQAHSLSNIGSKGSNRLFPRRQLLADQTETDAISGNIAKHHHAALVAEYFAADGSQLCPACRVGDGRRAAALIDRPDYQDLSFERIVRECALCDTHGFLVTARNADSQEDTAARQKINKDTLIDFSYALALPDRHAETGQLHTRVGTSKEDTRPLRRVRLVYQISLCGHRRRYAAGFASEPGWRACSYDASPFDRAQWSDHGTYGRWSFSPLFSA